LLTFLAGTYDFGPGRPDTVARQSKKIRAGRVVRLKQRSS
jgi:hypothetical protein